eukprot:7383133-Prymnesium_polylepis.1
MARPGDMAGMHGRLGGDAWGSWYHADLGVILGVIILGGEVWGGGNGEAEGEGGVQTRGEHAEHGERDCGCAGMHGEMPQWRVEFVWYNGRCDAKCDARSVMRGVMRGAI